MVRMKLVSVLKSTMFGKLFHTLTIRSLKNLARTVEEDYALVNSQYVHCVGGMCFSYYLVFIITVSNMEYMNTM